MATIKLSRCQEAIVDDEDFEMLSKHRWYAIKKKLKSMPSYYYAVRNNPGKKSPHLISMHRVVMGVADLDPKKVQVDHINRNGLDNRKENLRVCTNQENSWNRLRNHGSSSIYRGVFFHKASGLWGAKVCLSYKSVDLKYFKREIDAALHYDKLARKYFGEFAITNFVT